MKTLSAGLLAQASALGQAPCLLLEVANWNGTTYRFALSDASVTFGGNVYSARPFAFGAVRQSQDGGPTESTVTLANHDLAFSALCAAAEPIGATVSLRRVFLDALSSSQLLVAGLTVVAYQVSETAVALTVSSGGIDAPPKFPARTASRSCVWTYKGTECGFAGAEPPGETTCPHTIAGCTARANLLNYGGIPPAVSARA